MRIVVKGADYSAANLGNVNFFSQVLNKMGVTTANPAYNAFRTFLNSYESAGYLTAFSHSLLFGGGNATADGVDIIPVDNSKTTFINDDPSIHTIDGYAPAPTGTVRNAVVKNIPTSFDNFHMHAYINSPETSTANLPIVIGTRLNAAPLTYRAYISLYGNSDWKPRAVLGEDSNSAFVAASAISPSTVGLLSLYKNGSTVYLAINGTVVATKTYNGNPVFTPAVESGMGIGGLGNSATATGSPSGTRLRFVGWGNSAWDSAKDNQLKTILDTLESAI